MTRNQARAWLIGGSLLTIAAVLFVGTQAVTLVARDEETLDLTFPASEVQALDLRSDNGTVEIVGAAVDEISVVAEVDHGLRRTRHRAEVVDGVLELRASCPIVFSTWCDVHYRIVVPSALPIRAATDNGRLIVRDITADVQADGDNGSIELTRLSGDLSVATDNGRVEARGLRSAVVGADSDHGSVVLRFVTPPDRVRATSNHGSVEVELPDTPDAYHVQLDTDHGSTDVAVRTDPSSTRTIEASTDHGDVTVRYPSG